MSSAEHGGGEGGGKPRARLRELVCMAARDECADHNALQRRILLKYDPQRPRQYHLDDFAGLPQPPAREPVSCSILISTCCSFRSPPGEPETREEYSLVDLYLKNTL